MQIVFRKKDKTSILIDPVDYDFVNGFTIKGITKQGYPIVRSWNSSDAPLVLIYRLIIERYLNRTLKPEEKIDHIDGNPLNNSRSNLRVCTQQQNLLNRRVSKKRSLPKGITWDKTRSKWVVQIACKPNKKIMKRFKSFDDALIFCLHERQKMHGQFSNHGFPQPTICTQEFSGAPK